MLHLKTSRKPPKEHPDRQKHVTMLNERKEVNFKKYLCQFETGSDIFPAIRNLVQNYIDICYHSHHISLCPCLLMSGMRVQIKHEL